MKYELFMLCPPWKKYRLYKRSKLILTDSISSEMWRAIRAFDFLKSCLAELACNEHIVFVWVTDKFTEDCREYMGSLGYTFDRCLFWKRPKWKRGSMSEVFEYLMVFQKDGYKAPLRKYPDTLESPFSGKVRTRTEKPDDAYSLIEELYHARAKVQLFGSCRRPGWDLFHRNDT
jgi:N6-adenosine-specific RNA methylase IME4